MNQINIFSHEIHNKLSQDIFSHEIHNQLS